LELIKIGFYHNDDKFDNYGFKLIDETTEVNDRFKRINLPKIGNKFIYIYFIDWDSGLVELKLTKNGIYDSEQDFKLIREDVAKVYTDGYESLVTKINKNFNFGVFGGYNLSSIISSIINLTYIKSDIIENILSNDNSLDRFNPNKDDYELSERFRRKNVDNFKFLNKKYSYNINFNEKLIGENNEITINNIEKFVGYEPGSTTKELLSKGFKDKDAKDLIFETVVYK